MLCVIFRGKPTFHKITTGPDSDLLTNGKKFGSCSTVAALVKQLGTKQKNWPVPLINPVPKPEPIAPLSPVIEAEEPSVALPIVNPANANGGSTGSLAGGAASDNDDPVFPHMDRAACLGECQTDIDLPACCI